MILEATDALFCCVWRELCEWEESTGSSVDAVELWEEDKRILCPVTGEEDNDLKMILVATDAVFFGGWGELCEGEESTDNSIDEVELWEEDKRIWCPVTGEDDNRDDL